jgi:hypothetical protein
MNFAITLSFLFLFSVFSLVSDGRNLLAALGAVNWLALLGRTTTQRKQQIIQTQKRAKIAGFLVVRIYAK